MRWECSVCGEYAESYCLVCHAPLCYAHACLKQPGGPGYYCKAHIPRPTAQHSAQSDAHLTAAQHQHGNDLVLTVELVPTPCWYSTLREKMTRAAWDTLRRSVYREYGHRCGICGAEGLLHCHERWEYDDTTHIQRLAGFIALCVWCHHVKHIGHAGILASEGKLDMDGVIAHFQAVNQCDRTTFLAHRDAAFVQWRERNQHLWQTEFGEFQELINPRTAQ